jgi:uncharacterized protein (TIGR03437 family)
MRTFAPPCGAIPHGTRRLRPHAFHVSKLAGESSRSGTILTRHHRPIPPICKIRTNLLHKGTLKDTNRSYYESVKTNRATLACIFIFAATAALGQTPVISSGGVVNGATFAPGAVAPGSIASIFGTNLAGSLAQASTIPLSTTLSDVSVKVNGESAPLYFVSPDQPGTPGSSQINVQIPWDVLTTASNGMASVVVTRAGIGSSQPATVQVADLGPGILQSSGHAIAINADGTLAAPPNSIPGLTTHPATAGDVLIVYASGLGAVTPPVANGANSIDQLRKTVVTPVVLVGGVSAQVQFSGLSPQFTGVNQLNIVVPSGVTANNAVPLQIQVGSITTSNQVTIAIR